MRGPLAAAAAAAAAAARRARRRRRRRHAGQRRRRGGREARGERAAFFSFASRLAAAPSTSVRDAPEARAVVSAAAASVGENATRSRARRRTEGSARQSPSCARVASVYAARTSSACHRNAGAAFASRGCEQRVERHQGRVFGRRRRRVRRPRLRRRKRRTRREARRARARETGRSTPMGAAARPVASQFDVARARAQSTTARAARPGGSARRVRAARSNARIVSGLRSANVNASPRLSFRRFDEDNAHRAAPRVAASARFFCVRPSRARRTRRRPRRAR